MKKHPELLHVKQTFGYFCWLLQLAISFSYLSLLYSLKRSYKENKCTWYFFLKPTRTLHYKMFWISISWAASSFCLLSFPGDICGFVAAVLFGVDAYQLRNHRPYWLFGSRPPQQRWFSFFVRILILDCTLLTACLQVANFVCMAP